MLSKAFQKWKQHGCELWLRKKLLAEAAQCQWYFVKGM